MKITMNVRRTVPNPDLAVVEGNKVFWTHADHRRYGFHELHRLARYFMGFRAAQVMPLEPRPQRRIAELAAVEKYTSLACFSAMVVVRGSEILFERYAPDFGADHPHSIQSITKTTMNLIVGQLVERGVLDLARKVSYYLPQIGSGYAEASLQQVLNMDVVNDYTEDFTDPQATYYSHEEAMGWRLPRDSQCEETQRSFISRILSSDTTNRTGQLQYKDANTEVLGWVAEKASGRPLRDFFAGIADAAGLEGTLYVTTDREGVPCVSGGVSLTARDLARYFSIFAREGRGVDGRPVGSAEFIAQTLKGGIPLPRPYERMRYSNHTRVTGRSLGHSGWGGQFALANLETGTIGVFLSVLENEHATTGEYLPPVVEMLESITSMTPET